MAGYRYLVDANTLSDFIRNPNGSVTKRLAVVGVATVCTSIIVACELRYGVAKKGSARLAERVGQALEGLEVLPLDGGADRHYAEILAHLSRKGQPIGANDLLIAAHALALDLTLVTANVDEFSFQDFSSRIGWSPSALDDRYLPQEFQLLRRRALVSSAGGKAE